MMPRPFYAVVIFCLALAGNLQGVELDPIGTLPQTAPIFGTNGQTVLAAWMETTVTSSTVVFAVIDDRGNSLAMSRHPGWLAGDTIASDGDGYLLLIRSARMGGKLDAIRVDRNGHLLGVTRLEERHTLDAGVVWNGSSYLVVWFALSTESLGGVLNSATLDASLEKPVALPIQLLYERSATATYDWIWIRRSGDTILLLFRQSDTPPCFPGGCFTENLLYATLLDLHGQAADGTVMLLQTDAPPGSACVAASGSDFLVATLGWKRKTQARIIPSNLPLRAGIARLLTVPEYGMVPTFVENIPQRCAAAWDGAEYVTAIGYGPGANRYVVVETLNRDGESISLEATRSLPPQAASTSYGSRESFTSVLALSDNRLLLGRSEGPAAFSKAVVFTDDEIREMPPLPAPPRVVSIRGISGHADVSWTSGGPHADGYILTLQGPLLGVPTIVEGPATAGTFRIFDRLPGASIRAFNASGLSPLVPNRRRAAASQWSP